MYALIALALTLPPSLAAGVWALVWLQRERDRKINLEDSATLHAVKGACNAHSDELTDIRQRLVNAEKHIGQLTDRSMR